MTGACAADVFGNLIELRHGHIQNVALVVEDLDIVLDRAASLELGDALEHADAVRVVHDIIAAVHLLETVKRVLILDLCAPFFRRADIAAAVGDERKALLRVLKARRNAARQHGDLSVREIRRTHGKIRAAVAVRLQIERKRLRRFGRAAENHGRPVDAAVQRIDVVQQYGIAAVPRRLLAGVHGHEIFDRRIERAARQIVEIDRAENLILYEQLVERKGVAVQSRAQRSFLQQRLHLLMEQIERGGCVLAHGKALADEQDRIVRVIEQRRGLGVQQRHKHVRALARLPLLPCFALQISSSERTATGFLLVLH